MPQNFSQGDFVSPATGFPESNYSDLSARFYSESALNNGFGDVAGRSIAAADVGQLVFDNPYGSFSGSDSEVPLLGPQLQSSLEQAGKLEFSTPIDNQASGREPDFRLVQGTDGKLRLEPVGDGNPLADGKINIELDTGNKSLMEAIQQADKNLKEYIRELMSYWAKSHPGEDYPGWWNDILNSQPNIPDNPAPVPIEPTPSQFRPESSPVPEPPSAPQQGWQPDYRSGGGGGYGGSGSGGGDGGSGGGDGYYHGGGGDGGAPSYKVPDAVPNFDDSTGFVDRLTKTIMKNEGALNGDGSPRFEAYNPDDNGGISVGLRQWHAGGALPELLNAWNDKNPDKFQQYFHGASPAQINAMSSAEFAARPELVQGMKGALADKEYQGVQLHLINDWVKREVKMGMDMGLSSEKELATFVDIANQYGQDDANRAASLGRAGGDQASQMNASVRGGQYAERFAMIDANFSSANADLREKTPQPGEFGLRLAEAAKGVDSNMAGTGNCAAAVQYALKDAGMGQFMGSGDGWDMRKSLEQSGLFVRVPESQAAVGDIIVRSWSAQTQAENGGKNYGDISVVTAREGGRITQTNDATYEFEKNNPRYGDTYFLRYAGDAQANKKENVASADGGGDRNAATGVQRTAAVVSGDGKAGEKPGVANNEHAVAAASANAKAGDKPVAGSDHAAAASAGSGKHDAGKAAHHDNHVAAKADTHLAAAGNTAHKAEDSVHKATAKKHA